MNSAMKSMSHEIRNGLCPQLSHILSGSSRTETPHLSPHCSETLWPRSEVSIFLGEVASCCDAGEGPATRGVAHTMPLVDEDAGGPSLTSGPAV